jgi:phosphatidylglycerol lysyltransferase
MVTIHPKEGGSPLWEDAPPLGRTIAELTRAHGHHPLAFFGLAPGVGHFLAPGGRGLVNYRLVNHTAVVLGDPLCAPEAVEPVTRGFLELCASYRWSVAFYQASARFLAGARAQPAFAQDRGRGLPLAPAVYAPGSRACECAHQLSARRARGNRDPVV